MSLAFDPYTAAIIADNSSFILKFWPNTNSAELTIKDGVIYDVPEAKMTKQFLEELEPGSRIFLLVSSVGFFRATKRVRKLGATKAFSSHLAAVGFYTNNASLALLGELFNKINKPLVPTRIFHERDSAVEWLEEQKQISRMAQPFQLGAHDSSQYFSSQDQSL